MVSRSKIVSIPESQNIDPKVEPKATRRQHTKEFKLKILKEAASLKDSGSIGAMLRREGLYHSQLATWQKAFANHGEAGLFQKKRGAKQQSNAQIRQALEKMTRAHARLERKLAQAETIIEIQKKVASLLGLPLVSHETDKSDY